MVPLDVKRDVGKHAAVTSRDGLRLGAVGVAISGAPRTADPQRSEVFANVVDGSAVALGGFRRLYRTGRLAQI